MGDHTRPKVHFFQMCHPLPRHSPTQPTTHARLSTVSCPHTAHNPCPSLYRLPPPHRPQPKPTSLPSPAPTQPTTQAHLSTVSRPPQHPQPRRLPTSPRLPHQHTSIVSPASERELHTQTVPLVCISLAPFSRPRTPLQRKSNDLFGAEKPTPNSKNFTRPNITSADEQKSG